MHPIFLLPTRILIAGSTNSGKTTLITKIILNREKMFVGESIKKILFCCKKRSFVPDKLKKINILSVYEGVPQIEELDENTLIVFDDLMMDVFTKEICEIFTINSHHKNISVIISLQNIFHKNPLLRDISLSASYIIFMKSPRDSQQFSFLARQISPKYAKDLQMVYIEATKLPFSYLILDLNQQTNDLCRIKADIFNKDYYTCYANVSEKLS